MISWMSSLTCHVHVNHKNDGNEEGWGGGERITFG